MNKLLEACREALPYIQYLAENGSGNKDTDRTCDLLEQAIAEAEAAPPVDPHVEITVQELLTALVDLKRELWAAGLKLNVRKHYSLLTADAQAGTAILKAKGPAPDAPVPR